MEMMLWAWGGGLRGARRAGRPRDRGASPARFTPPLCFPKPGCSFLFLVCVWGGERPRQRVPPFCCVPGAPTPSQSPPCFQAAAPPQRGGAPPGPGDVACRCLFVLFCFCFDLFCVWCGRPAGTIPALSPRANPRGSCRRGKVSGEKQRPEQHTLTHERAVEARGAGTGRGRGEQRCSAWAGTPRAGQVS